MSIFDDFSAGVELCNVRHKSLTSQFQVAFNSKVDMRHMALLWKISCYERIFVGNMERVFGVHSIVETSRVNLQQPNIECKRHTWNGVRWLLCQQAFLIVVVFMIARVICTAL